MECNVLDGHGTQVDLMIKKVKAIKSDFYNLEADFKTQAHRQLSIALKPRGNKGPAGMCINIPNWGARQRSAITLYTLYRGVQ